MHKLDINRYDENKKQIGQPVKPESNGLIRQERYQGNININQGAEETYAGKKDVGGIFLPPKNGEETQEGKDNKSGHREEKVGI